MSVFTPETKTPGSTAPTIIQGDDFVSLVFADKSKGGSYEVGAETKVETDAALIKAVFTSLEGTPLDLSLSSGTFKKCKINGSELDDSIVIGEDAETKGKLKINAGGGSNTIEFEKEPTSTTVIKFASDENNVIKNEIIIENQSFDITDDDLKDVYDIKIKFIDS